MNVQYPLQFKPLFRRYLWGGRKLASVLGKPIGDEDAAESWEVVDHGDDQSIVANGPLAGTPLARLVESAGESLFGRHAPQDRFPLLFKFLDAQKTLSVQVHPNDAQAAKLNPPDLGKTEAWVVLDAEPGAKIYAGIKRGFDRRALERELAQGTCELCLHAFEAAPGDCVFIPAGTVHALGAGLVIAEIQQASDTTFRLFDWNRVGADGQPRELHIEQALDVIDFDRGPVNPVTPQPTGDPNVQRLVTSDKFILDRHALTDKATIGGDDRFHILAVLDGEIEINHEHLRGTLGKGKTVLLPSAAGGVSFTCGEPAVLLDAYLP